MFCACSWTWCIGMYLPVILLRELGWPAVIAFAAPNLVGCAAFGYLLRDPAGRAQSRRRGSSDTPNPRPRDPFFEARERLFGPVARVFGLRPEGPLRDRKAVL